MKFKQYLKEDTIEKFIKESHYGPIFKHFLKKFNITSIFTYEYKCYGSNRASEYDKCYGSNRAYVFYQKNDMIYWCIWELDNDVEYSELGSLCDNKNFVSIIIKEIEHELKDDNILDLKLVYSDRHYPGYSKKEYDPRDEIDQMEYAD